jgi:hypothetical protein
MSSNLTQVHTEVRFELGIYSTYTKLLGNNSSIVTPLYRFGNSVKQGSLDSNSVTISTMLHGLFLHCLNFYKADVCY